MNNVAAQSVVNIFGPVIIQYSQKNAIEDGMMFDVTQDVKPRGINLPAVMTYSLFCELFPNTEREDVDADDYAVVMDMLVSGLICQVNHTANVSQIEYETKNISGGYVMLIAELSENDNGEMSLFLMTRRDM